MNSFINSFVELPDFQGSIIMRRGAQVVDVCRAIHRDFEQNLKYANVWGRSAKHSPQRVGLSMIFNLHLY